VVFWQGARLDPGLTARGLRLGDDYAMLGGVRVTWSYVASCRYLRTLFVEGRRTRGLREAERTCAAAISSRLTYYVVRWTGRSDGQRVEEGARCGKRSLDPASS
jgi:hypothetical protein